MKIDVRFRSLTPSSTLKRHTERRVRAHLGRFGRELVAVLVRVGDLNGPKGGVDKLCRIVLRSRRLGLATVEERSASATAAVDAAVKRAARALRRKLERSHWRRGKMPAPEPGF